MILTHHEAQVPEVNKDVLWSIGTPNKSFSCNIEDLNGTVWSNNDHDNCIEKGFHFPNYQNQNIYIDMHILC